MYYSTGGGWVEVGIIGLCIGGLLNQNPRLLDRGFGWCRFNYLLMSESYL